MFESHHPKMIEKSGHIINIGSTAAKKFIQTGMYIVLQNMRLTPKSRHANGFKPFGIRVPSIPEWCKLNLVKCVLREIRIEPKRIYQGFTPLQPEDIADIIHFVVSDPIMLLPI
jgi:NADP-dependent 3-hydroxy acid dehydrogenase YdfG